MEIVRSAWEPQHSKGMCYPPSSSLGKQRSLSSEAAFFLVFHLWNFFGGDSIFFFSVLNCIKSLEE